MNKRQKQIIEFAKKNQSFKNKDLVGLFVYQAGKADVLINYFFN